MKFVLFNDNCPGLLKGENVVDISEVVASVKGDNGQKTMEGIIENYDSLKGDLETCLSNNSGVPLTDVTLMPPLPRPDKIVAMGANYTENIDAPPLPIFAFYKSQDSIVGPGGTIVLPEIETRIFHHEAELVAVIGKTAKNVKEADAMDYIFGYTCGIDVSARYPAVPRSLLGKSHDTFSPIGPCIVTKDEIADVDNLQIKFWVDGQPRHDFNTSDMGHKIPTCIEFMSSITTMRPGDLLFTGTNHQGIGPLQDGENVVMEIEGIGQLCLDVTDALKRSWPKEIDAEIGARIRVMVKSGIPPGAPGAPGGPAD